MEDLDKPCAEYEAIRPLWDMIDTILGGTSAMRAAGKTYLPQEPNEEDADYQTRLDRSFLFNAYKRVTGSIAAKPFKKAVALGDDVTPEIAALAENIDQRGNNLTIFTARRFQELLRFGVCHFLVDHPPKMPEGATLADERAAGVRPYWVPIPARSLIGWRFEEVNGAPVLTQIRILESHAKPEGDVGEKIVKRVRVIEPDNWRIYEEGDDGSWTLVDEGEMTLGYIPLVTVVAGESKSNVTAKPPLEDLAWLNLEHWQSASDQRHVLHIARVPILVAAGFNSEDGDMAIGPNTVVMAPDANASLSYVEHGGASIGAGRQEILDIEEKMMSMGLELLTRREGEITATQAGIEHDSANSQLALLVQAMQDGVELGLQITANWLKLPDEAGGSAEIFKDFATDESRKDDIATLLDMRRLGEISRETFYAELKRRGFLPDDFDAEQEDMRLAAEAMSSAELSAELDLERAPVDAEIQQITAPPPDPNAAPVAA